jgi:hypothetical protein
MVLQRLRLWPAVGEVLVHLALCAGRAQERLSAFARLLCAISARADHAKRAIDVAIMAN